jgi:hypothetical protein
MDEGLRRTSTRSISSTLTNEALGPVRRSEAIRALSIRMRMRLRAMPRIVGTIENPPVPRGATPIARSRAPVKLAAGASPRETDDSTVAAAGMRAVGSG